MDAIRSVILAKRLLDSKSKDRGNTNNKYTGIKVLFVTEQAPSDSSLLDYSVSHGTSTAHKIDVTKALSDVCNESNKCSTHVFTDESISMLQSFSVLCQADVLLPAASGFSHIAAVLCRPKLTVTVPFWYVILYGFIEIYCIISLFKYIYLYRCSYDVTPSINQVSIYEKATLAQTNMYDNSTWIRLGIDMIGAGGVSVGSVQRDMRRVIDFATVLVDKMILMK